jgi:hypothetical protein
MLSSLLRDVTVTVSRTFASGALPSAGVSAVCAIPGALWKASAAKAEVATSRLERDMQVILWVVFAMQRRVLFHTVSHSLTYQMFFSNVTTRKISDQK